jgi:membrane protease YdiL (CAAX protease family)
VIDLVLHAIAALLSFLPKTLTVAYLMEIILMIVPVAIVFFFGFSRAFKNGSFFRGLFCCLPFIILQLFVLIFFFANNIGDPEVDWKPWYLIIYGLVSIVGVGVREECIYRATLQNIVAKKYANSVKGVWITAIIGAIIFGLTHASNIFYGMEPLAVLAQMISATFVGLLFGAVYLRSGSLWAIILVHTLTDIASLTSSTFLNVSDIADLNQMANVWSLFRGKLLVWLFYIGLTAFLLRPSKCKQIYESLCFAGEGSDEDPCV